MNIEKVVLDAFAEVVKGKEITRDMKIKDLGIDSLDLVEIVMEAEEEFGIAFSNDELNNFTTVNDVVNAIKSKK